VSRSAHATWGSCRLAFSLGFDRASSDSCVGRFPFPMPSAELGEQIPLVPHFQALVASQQEFLKIRMGG
jgi:hypothetical protein